MLEVVYTNDLGFQAEYKFERILKLSSHTPTRKYHLEKHALLKDFADHLERCKLQHHSEIIYKYLCLHLVIVRMLVVQMQVTI